MWVLDFKEDTGIISFASCPCFFAAAILQVIVSVMPPFSFAPSRRCLFLAVANCLSLLLFLPAPASAKEAPLNAIVLYDTEKGPAYLQVTDLLINGKAELRTCSTGQRIDKSAYGRLPKVTLAGATLLERTADGLILTKDSGPICVVPVNLKFEKDAAYTPAELADKAILQGRTAASPSGDQGLPTFGAGVKVVFVAAPDVDLAEYLLAQRTNTIVEWQDYLARYGDSPHASPAKDSLASLLVKDGEDHLSAYRRSVSSPNPAFADLNTAKVRLGQCLKLVANYGPASKLQNEVSGELASLSSQAQSEWNAYKEALSGHKPGYVHLTQAQNLVGHILEIDPQFQAGQALQRLTADEVQKFEASLHTADTLTKSQRFDDAYAAVTPYLAFAEEDTRIATVIRATCSYHLDRARNAQTAGNWQEAVQESQRALQITETKEAETLLKQSQAGLLSSQNRAAADKALADSEEFEKTKNYIDAYEVLADLESGPRALVADRMQALESAYIKAASQKAMELQQAHTPIKGKVDEQDVQHAYDYLERASSLNADDKNLKLRLDLLGETISDYYLQQARRYLEKPLGSGVGLAWLYLDVAQQYKANRDDVKDERVKSAAIYQMRSKLSIRVVFRDQTSRRDSPLFAEQLSDAIATGLETSGLAVKVIRSTDTPAAEPNFQLIGDVLQHRTVVNQTVESAQSKYRAGEREIPNEDWNKANREYESAMLDLQNAQRVLEGAQARGKKKQIDEATAAVSAAQQKVQDAHQKLDAIQKTTLEDIIKDYTYTKKNIDLDAVVELAFRLVDTNGNSLDAAPPIQRKTHKVFTVLENVKPEDTEGVKPEGAPPNELQFLTDIEIEGRDTLIKSVKEKVENLPNKILDQARKKAAEGDLDGAAESYILFLNSSSDARSTERNEAKRFLLDQFNIREVNLAAS